MGRFDRFRNSVLWSFLRFVKIKLIGFRNFALNLKTYILSKKSKKRPKGTLRLIIHDNRFERCLLPLIYFLNEYQYKVALSFSYSFLSKLGMYAKRILTMENVILDLSRRKTNYIQLSDSDHITSIDITENYYHNICYAESSFRVPYSFHPNLLHFQNESYLPTLRNPDKLDIKCFFAGNTDPSLYNEDAIIDIYGILTRGQIIDFIKLAFPDSHTGYLGEGNYDIIIHDDNSDRIPQLKLLEILSRAKFFLATPGVIIPDCHNLTEAMALGAIPIIQFPYFMNPPLKHGINCLSYNSLDELKDILKKVLNDEFSATEIAEMRVNVIAYYRENLSMEGVISKFESRLVGLERICLNAEYVTTNKLIESGETVIRKGKADY